MNKNKSNTSSTSSATPDVEAFSDREVVFRSSETGSGALEAYFQPYNGTNKAHLRFVTTRKSDGGQRPGKGIAVEPHLVPKLLAAAAALLLAQERS